MTRRGTIAILLVAAAAALAVGAEGPPAADAVSTLRSACVGQDDAGAPAAAQQQRMLCLVNQARSRHGLRPLAAPGALRRAARRKSADILRCDEFSHEACGRPFTYWISRFGYRGCREGENIAWGSGSYATPHSIFTMWMHSSGHRRNILGPYSETGLGLRVGSLEGHGGAHVWTEEFGARSC